jgi:hypothetical protein
MSMRTALVAAALLLSCARGAAAQDHAPVATDDSASKRVALFLAGGAVALGAHESGHLLFDVVFDADPHVKKVDFHGIPFFAITPRAPLTSREEIVVSSAGFWVQHATDEWLLTKRPHLRRARAPLAKGVLAFNVLASIAYSGAAVARTGPDERDTRGIASGARIDERWVGVMILTPAVLDAVRYFNPDAKWAVWASRAAKIGMVFVVFR